MRLEAAPRRPPARPGRDAHQPQAVLSFSVGNTKSTILQRRQLVLATRWFRGDYNAQGRRAQAWLTCLWGGLIPRRRRRGAGSEGACNEASAHGAPVPERLG